jgi:hypothetical protein
MRFRNTVLAILVCIACLVVVPAVRADVFTVYGWRTTEAIASSATGGSPASLLLPTCHNGVAACVNSSNVPQNVDVGFFLNNTFPDFDIEFEGTVSDWLASGGITPVKNLLNGPYDWMDPTIWDIRGTINITGNEKFSIYHDDGVTLAIDGVSWGQPGPAYPGLDLLSVDLATQYTGPTGKVSFDLVYAECCGGPARLVMTPEPAAVISLGTLLLLLVQVIKRTRSHS